MFIDSKIFLVGLIGLGLSTGSLAHAAHDLSPDLRVRVDALKAEAATQKSTFENARARAEIVLKWGNAIAVTGEHIPINLTMVTGLILTADEIRPQTLGRLRSLDRYIYELSLRDEHPDGLGSVMIDAPEESPAQSWQTVAVTYTVGPVPIAENGRILLARQIMIDLGFLQRDAPSADNYLSIRSSNPNASFVKETFPWSGPHGGFRSPAPSFVYRLTGTSLSEGETITLTLGDRSGGSRGYQMQTFSNDACPVPVYINFENNDHFVSFPLPTYRVSGAEPYAVQGFAPSIVKAGEPFSVSVRTEDFFYNRATGPIPKYDVTLNGRTYSTIAAGQDAITNIDVTFEKPGIYRFQFESADGSISGVCNPIWVRDDPPWRVYWGETHGHSGFAEGQGSIDGYFDFAREDARLDYICLSEHDIWLDDYEWKRLNDTSREYSVKDKLIVFPGYEWSARRQYGGHHNVFFRVGGHEMVPTRQAPRLSQLYRQLHAQNDPKDVLIIPHAHQAGDWRASDVEMEHLVEIHSGHGTFEWFGRRYLEHGHRVGFVGASDDHVGHPGYAAGRGRRGTRSNIGNFGGLGGVIAAEKTRDAIFDALRARSAYATSHSQRIILDIALNGETMGSQLPFSKTVAIEGRVIGTGVIDTIDVVKNGEVVWTKKVAASKLRSSVDVQLSFDSDSDPLMRDNPRGYRIWKGYVTVSDATIESFDFPGKLNPSVDRVARDPSNPERLNFDIATRGLIYGINLSLSGASKNTELSIHLEESYEGGKAPVHVRPNASIPEANVSFRLEEADGENGLREFQVGRYTDVMRLRIVSPDGPMDQSFAYSETDGVYPGDYYYVRVRQLDGALAWSSPFWVGGEPSQ